MVIINQLNQSSQLDSNIQRFLESIFDPRGIKPDSILQGTLDKGPNGIIGAYDPKLYNGAGFGKRIRYSLGYGNDGSSYNVTDLGQVVVVVARYFHQPTGKEISKVFAIVFGLPEFAGKLGAGRVFTTSTKWRDISTPEQGANYIKMYVNSMSSGTKSV